MSDQQHQTEAANGQSELTAGLEDRLQELELALEQAVESFDIIHDRLIKYQCEGRSLNSIHDVFEVARLGQSLRVLLSSNL